MTKVNFYDSIDDSMLKFAFFFKGFLFAIITANFSIESSMLS